MEAFTKHYQGKQLGNYQLLKLLGEGGTSEVYLGEHVYLGTQAAIKVLHTRLTEEEFQRFRQEAQIIIGLSHPNLIRVLDFGLQDHTPFIVMTYAPSGSLRDRYPTGSCLPLETVVSLIKQIAPVLQYAHDHHVIHRDIKPDNLLIGPDEEILLSDFGIAVAFHNTYSTRTQEAIGTVAYTAPEQLRRKARPASDQYSLGIVVYEWLCGTVPFEGQAIEIALQHINDSPPPLRDKCPDLPPAIEQVVLKALAKEPQERFESVKTFAEALEQAYHTQEISPISSTPEPPTPSYSEGTKKDQGPVTNLDAQDTQQNARMTLSPERKGVSPWKDASSNTGHLLLSVGLLLLLFLGAISYSLYSFLRPHFVSQPHLTVSTSTQRPSPTPTPAPTTPPVPTPPPVIPAQPPIHQLTMGSAVRSVSWSPGGRMAAISDERGDIGVWQISGTWLWRLNLGTKIWSIAWSPDGSSAARLAVASDDGKVRILDGLNGHQLLVYTGHSHTSVLSVAWEVGSSLTTPHGVVSGDINGMIHVWDSDNGQTLLTLSQSAAVTGLSWTNSWIISSGAFPGQQYVIWNTDPNNQLTDASHIMFQFTNNVNLSATSPAGTLTAVAWSIDGNTAAVGDANGNISFLSDIACSCILYETGIHAHNSQINAISWSPENQTFATASDDGTLRTWIVVSPPIIVNQSDASLYGKTKLFLRQTFINPSHSKVLTVAWSPDGHFLLSGDEAGNILLWQVAS